MIRTRADPACVLDCRRAGFLADLTTDRCGSLLGRHFASSKQTCAKVGALSRVPALMAAEHEHA